MISLCTYYCMCKTNLVLVHSNHRFRRKETQKFVIIQIRYLCAFSYISDHLLASIHYIHGKTRYKIFIRKIYKINITFVLTLKSVDKIYKNIGLTKVEKINITFVLTLKSVDKIYKNIGLTKVTK